MGDIISPDGGGLMKYQNLETDNESMLHYLALANLSQEIHESIASNYSERNYSEASNFSLSQSNADSYPSLSQLCNEIDQSLEARLLAQAEAIEDELSIPDLPLLYGEKCSVCLLEAMDSKFIKCKLCRKSVHYNCNNPKVSAYYKKQCANCRCQFCKLK